MGITPLSRLHREPGQPSEYFLERSEGLWVLERAGQKPRVRCWHGYDQALRESQALAAADPHGALLVVITTLHYRRHRQSFHYPRHPTTPPEE